MAYIVFEFYRNQKHIEKIPQNTLIFNRSCLVALQEKKHINFPISWAHDIFVVEIKEISMLLKPNYKNSL